MDISIKVQRLKEVTLMRIHEIEKLDSYLFRNICLFSIVEQYAQDNGGYGRKNTDMMNNFLTSYSKDDLLTKFDAVTLYYHNQELLDDKGINLNYLHKYKNPIVKSSEIVDLAETETIINNCDKKYNHTYSNLIYKFRCKLSHELNSPSTIWEDDQLTNEPFYSFVSPIPDDGVPSWRWQLHFPYEFLKTTFINSIFTYLDDCIEKNKRPFEKLPNYLHWYE